MSFIAPLFLLAAFAIALPFWLHRLQTQSSDRKPFSSAMLLETTEQQIHVQKKLKYLLLLALRALLLLLVALIFAKPLWIDSGTLAGPGPDGTHLVVVDTSASMARDGAFASALDAARAAIDAAPADALLQVISAANGIGVESPLSPDDAEHAAALQRLEPASVALDFGHMMAALHRHAETVPAPVTVHLVSDFQASGLPVRFSDLVSARIETLVPHRVQAEQRGNWSVSAIREIAAGVDVVIVAEGDDDMSASLDVTLNGTVIGSRVLTGPGTTTQRFDALPFVEGDNRVTARIAVDDVFPLDDARFHVIDKLPPAPIPLITFDQGGLPVTYLTAALQSDPEARYEVALAVISDFDPRTLGRYQWLIIDDIGVISPELETTLVDFVDNGGNILAFAGRRTAGATRIPVTGNAIEGASAGVAADRFVSIGQVDGGHPALAATDGWYSVNLTQTVPISVTNQDQVLMRLENDEPFMIERRIGAGRVLLVAGGLENRWNDLPIRPVFVSFVVEAARYLSGVDRVARSYTAGDALPLGVVGGSAGQVIDPDGDTVLSLADTARAQHVTLDKIGFYEVYTPQGDYVAAVNLDASESEHDVIDVELLHRWIEAMGGEAGPQVTSTFTQEAKPVELWHVLLLILALVLIGESMLGNWHLAPRTQRPGP